jgi:hypothetical protein
MERIKIHTSNPKNVENILNNTFIRGEFWDYTLEYEYDYKNHNLYELENKYYFNMPEFKWSSAIFDRVIINVYYKNQEEKDILYNAFNEPQTKLNYFHYQLNEFPYKEYEYEYTHKIEPKYPIYVITKGRWEKTLTIDTLEEMGIHFNICVEPDEYDKYISNPKVDPDKVIKLPENFSERKQGSIPVRNFAWEHSIKNGYSKHWIIDDNIDGFYRWNCNLKKKVKDGVFFRIMEDFSDRFENLGLVGCQYSSFIAANEPLKGQFITNTRVYSTTLINSKLLDKRLEERWRGTYNEDTDLTLRVLSTGDLCTVNFNSLLSGKQTTGSMKGGNTTTIYEFDKKSDTESKQFTGLKKKFDELKENWGDIVTYTTRRHKDGRPHHHIAYTRYFKQELKLKDGISTEPIINNYNMKLVKK